MVNEHGQPWAVDIRAANRGEVKVCLSVACKVPKKCWLTADMAYDAPWFRKWLLNRGVWPSIRFKAFWHGGRHEKLPGRPAENPAVNGQRYVVERSFSWFETFKRLNIRYERHDYLYKAFWELASVCLLWRALTG